ncbi:MAG: FHA domain-containing protein [Chloroflexota bacterium]|nr:FHA domain-containing protein [Chloroflexota bacterium]
MANPLAAIEKQFERFIERPLMRLFGARLEPADIAKHLAREMEDERHLFSGKLVGPNYYEVKLSPEDAEGFESYKGTLRQDLSDYLIDLAQRRGITLLGRPEIVFVETAGMGRGDVEVRARLVDRSAEGHTRQFTQPLQAIELETSQEVSSSAWLELPDRTVALNQPYLTLGRSIDNDIILEGDDVSRHHAEIKLRGRHYVLTDLDSANGTRVNGKRITECVLQNGDEVCLAAVCMTFKTAGAWR